MAQSRQSNRSFSDDTATYTTMTGSHMVTLLLGKPHSENLANTEPAAVVLMLVPMLDCPAADAQHLYPQMLVGASVCCSKQQPAWPPCVIFTGAEQKVLPTCLRYGRHSSSCCLVLHVRPTPICALTPLSFCRLSRESS
jgi:hypothetical protein